jgi:FMN phosphatase YigB (HAD superfamily)
VSQLCFLVDLDNTLLDNDAAKADLAAGITALIGAPLNDDFWSVYEGVREERDGVAYLATLARFQEAHPDEARFARVAALVLAYPYARQVYPGAFAALAHLKQLGQTAILSDGDPVYQAAKVALAGLAAAVDDEVLIHTHKQARLMAVEQRLPASHYVLIDDKPGVLAAVKARWGTRATTVLIRQGKYASPDEIGKYAPADRTLAHIQDVCNLTLADFPVL